MYRVEKTLTIARGRPPVISETWFEARVLLEASDDGQFRWSFTDAAVRSTADPAPSTIGRTDPPRGPLSEVEKEALRVPFRVRRSAEGLLDLVDGQDAFPRIEGLEHTLSTVYLHLASALVSARIHGISLEDDMVYRRDGTRSKRLSTLGASPREKVPRGQTLTTRHPQNGLCFEGIRRAADEELAQFAIIERYQIQGDGQARDFDELAGRATYRVRDGMVASYEIEMATGQSDTARRSPSKLKITLVSVTPPR